VHFAAETHVDRSIKNAGEFITTDVYGTFVLLEAARENPSCALRADLDRRGLRQRAGGLEQRDRRAAAAQSLLGEQGGRRSPGLQLLGDLQVPVVITRASNNYGPNQFPEKIIPLFITNLIDDIPVPLYGDGQNERDWLHVEDHCRGVDLLIDEGRAGEVYNIGGGNEVKNVDLTHRILELVGKPRRSSSRSRTARATIAAIRSTRAS
jgi:dTDP-glucose 4,6-dehydratase